MRPARLIPGGLFASKKTSVASGEPEAIPKNCPSYKRIPLEKGQGERII